MAASDTTLNPFQQALQRRGLRQFVKFCIVGFSSALIDFGVFLFLIEKVHLEQFTGSPVVTRTVAGAIAFLLAVTNGFIWNSLWTFREAGPQAAHRRYAKFVLTNTIGLGLNLLILNAVAHVVPAALVALFPVGMKDPRALIGKVVASAVVVFWNFTASKYWTFKS
jgi:putative flippase GtrA